MLAKPRRIATITLGLIIFALFAQPGNAQKKAISAAKQSTHPTKISSVTADLTGNFVLLNTNSKSALPSPSVQYLNGLDGKTTLIMDFNSVSWDKPSAVFYPANQNEILVRMGQFQSTPPIFRIAITSNEAPLLKLVDLRSQPGLLIVKFPDPKKLGTTTTLPEKAPRILTYTPPVLRGPIPVKPDTTDDTGPKAPPAVAPVAVLKTVSQKSPLSIPKPAPQQDGSPGKPDLNLDPESIASEPISLSIEKGDSFSLKIKAPKELEYKTFRLSDPERFVIDINEAAELASLSVPDFKPVSGVQAVRVGTPDPSGSTGRLVLDLESPSLAFEEVLSSDKKELSIALSKKPTLPEVAKGKVVVLDAGHGGTDPGAQRGDVQEKDLTLEICKRLKKTLEQRGIKVHMTRSDDTYVSLEDRVRITNSIAPDCFLSVHINSLESNSAIFGIETYYQNEKSPLLAKLIHNELVGQLKLPDRSVRKARFYVVNHTLHPAVLAEVGFISNKAERDKLISSEYQNSLATALAQGVMLYLSGEKNPTISENKSGESKSEKTGSRS